MLGYITSLISHCIPVNVKCYPIFTGYLYPVINNSVIVTKHISDIFESLNDIDACICLYKQNPNIKFGGPMMNEILDRYMPSKEQLTRINFNTLRDPILHKVIKEIGHTSDPHYHSFLINKKLTYLVGNPITSISEYRLALTASSVEEFTFLWNHATVETKLRLPLALPMNTAILCLNEIKLLIYEYYPNNLLLQLSAGIRIIPTEPVMPSIYYYLLKYNIPGQMIPEVDDCLQVMLAYATMEDKDIYLTIAQLLYQHSIHIPYNHTLVCHYINAKLLATVDNYWTVLPTKFKLDKCEVCEHIRSKFISI